VTSDVSQRKTPSRTGGPSQSWSVFTSSCFQFGKTVIQGYFPNTLLNAFLFVPRMGELSRPVKKVKNLETKSVCNQKIRHCGLWAILLQKIEI